MIPSAHKPFVVRDGTMGDSTAEKGFVFRQYTLVLRDKHNPAMEGARAATRVAFDGQVGATGSGAVAARLLRQGGAYCARERWRSRCAVQEEFESAIYCRQDLGTVSAYVS